jgi:hypothetical protein
MPPSSGRRPAANYLQLLLPAPLLRHSRPASPARAASERAGALFFSESYCGRGWEGKGESSSGLRISNQCLSVCMTRSPFPHFLSSLVLMPSLVAEITRPAPAKKIKGRMNTPPSDTNQSRWMYSPLDMEQPILGEGMLQLKLG